MKLTEFIRRVLGTKNLYKKTVENNSILQELNWANIFNNSIKGCKWLDGQRFSPGRWAAGYPFLFILFKTLEFAKPQRIIEFGLGQTTNMILRYTTAHEKVQTLTLEHDPHWVDFFLRGLDTPLNYRLIMVENTLTELYNTETLSISNLDDITRDDKFDLIIVDAPFGSERYSRSQVLQIVPFNINPDHFCIIIDDYDRAGEKETCVELEHIFWKNNITFSKGIYKGNKHTVIYCSEDVKFLASL